MILSPIGDIRVVVKTSGMLKSKGRKGPSIILTSTKIKVDLRVVTKVYSETVCRALIMTNNRHRQKEKREVILSSVQEIFPKLWLYYKERTRTIEYSCSQMFLAGPCGRPADIPHAKFHGSSFGYKDKLRYSCKKRYKLSGPRKRTCRENGKWSRPPTCSRKVFFSIIQYKGKFHVLRRARQGAGFGSVSSILGKRKHFCLKGLDVANVIYVFIIP